jgi:hypothetical protein
MLFVLRQYLFTCIDVWAEQFIARGKQGQHQEQGQQPEPPRTDNDDDTLINLKKQTN